MMKRVIIAAIVLAALCQTATASFEYALDDGTGVWTAGPSSFDAGFLWGNCFDVEPGYEVIDSISVSFAPDVPLGRDIHLVLFDDPNDDYDPSDAYPVSQTVGQTIDSDPNEFITYDIPDASVSGVFFVAAWMDLYQHEHAPRMDDSTPAGRSWIFFFPIGQVDVDDIGSSPLYYNMSLTFDGTWMLRANAIPEPASLGLLLVGAIPLLGRRRRRRA